MLSIFNTKSPIHDGAVIIKNGKIQAASCVLPVSTEIEVKHLGNYAYEYKGLYIELRPDTIFTDNTPPEMDFAIFEDEEDMNTDYELNIGTGYAAMTPYYRYWEAVMLYCDKLLK